jgi:4-amino-4-deoxy-L-arabinose transferase-like glycosyltransferase
VTRQLNALGQPQSAGVEWPAAGTPILVGLAAFAIFCVGLDRPPEFDELYHVLAARGWLETGELRIADGLYERTGLYSILVALLFQLFGESLVVARLPSVAASGILAALLFAWLRRWCGKSVAWVGTLFFVVSPFTIDFAQYTRFYALQSLVFVLGVMAVFRSVVGSDPPLRKAGLLLAAALAFATAFYLQVTTLVGLAGLGLWWSLAVVLPWWWRQPAARGTAWALAAVAATLVLAVLAVTSGIVDPYVDIFRSVPLFAAASANELWYYHFWLVLYYPTLWSLFPLLALVALAARPKPALLALCIFATALVLHSLAAFKGTRFIAYALPFLYVVFAVTLVEAWGWLRQTTQSALLHLVPTGHPAAAFQPWLERGALAAVLLFLVLANAAFVRSAFLLADIRVPPQPARVDWQAALPMLASHLARADVVITTNELEALYHLGDYDILLSRSRLSEMSGATDFDEDWRTGKPVIGSLEAMARLMDCFETGLIVSGRTHWRPAVLDEPTTEFIIRRTQRLDLPASANVLAYSWERPAGVESPEDCPAIAG